MADPSSNLKVDSQILSILRCPLTHSELTIQGAELVAAIGGLRYPIRDGFPVLIAEEAKLPEGIASLEEFKKKFAQNIDR